MKQKYLLAAAMLLSAQTALAQSPGGVGEPAVWSKDTASVHIPAASGLTYIGVSRVLADKEQAVWSLGKEGKASRIQTTERTADLYNGTFMNYAKDSLPEVRLYSYSSSLRPGEGDVLRIGGTADARLPVGHLDGGTMEYAVFTRQLSGQERCRVESYLALKYGVSLRTSYLNSRGTVIWNAYANRLYGHRIAGIIADAPSALYQNRAGSSEEGAFLTIGTARALADGQSLLWGDNNGRLAFATSRAYGKWLGRRWAAVMTGTDDVRIDLIADSRQLRQIQPLADGESYYLAIDPTGTGQFSVKSLQYCKAAGAAGDSIFFRNIHPAENAVFTLRAAKDMFTTVEVRQPGETNGNSGGLDMRVTGGVPPYKVRLSRGQSSVYDHTSGDSLRTIDGLAEGKYLLVTTDRLGNMAENEFQISTTGIAELPTEAGSDDADYFANFKASPNPTTDGYVNVQAELSERSPLTMALHTVGGAKISSISFESDTYFATKVYLPSTGVYLLTLVSGTHEKTVKLMRK